MANPEREETIYESEPSEPDDDIWLAYGAKMLEEAAPSIRTAAAELLKTLSILFTVYLGVLGFADLIPKEMETYNKVLFLLPIAPWLIALYYGLRAIKTEIFEINLRSPSDIKEKNAVNLRQKQGHLELAFLCLGLGIIFAFIMLVFRFQN